MVSTEVEAEMIVRDVATAVGLAEGAAGVREVLSVVSRREPVATRTISRASGLPVPIVAAVAGELRKRGIVARQRPTRLTVRGRRLFGPVRPQADIESRCPACDGLGLRPPDGLEPLVSSLADLASNAPPARTELDQSHCTPETKLRRALLLYDAGALERKRVLLLGDDDLVSLAILLLAERGGFECGIRELAIVDVDPAVLAFVKGALADSPIPTTLVEHDLRRPLPTSLRGRYDTVFTDPPYTVEGAELFLSRAASALASGGGDVFLAFGPKPPAEALRLQAAMVAMGFAIRRVVPNFNDYLHAGILGGTSHLYHLVATEGTRPAVGHFDGSLYTGESRAPRRYRCGSCGALQRVGRGSRWVTVEVLRREGCPECGATKFRPLPLVHSGKSGTTSAATRRRRAPR